MCVVSCHLEHYREVYQKVTYFVNFPLNKRVLNYKNRQQRNHLINIAIKGILSPVKRRTLLTGYEQQ